jgi:SOS-response transcriptional repressor LexA
VTALGETQIYRDLMRFKPEDLSPNAWAVKAGVSRTVWSDMRRHGNPSRRTLEKLLAAAGSSLLEFEALRLGPEPRPLPIGLGGQLGDMRRPWGAAPLQPLPLIASALGGEWGEAGSQVELTEIRPHEMLDRLPRPASLAADPEAYAFTIVGASMWPRFRTGSRVAVSPRSPVAIGDEVVARLRKREGAAKDGVEQVLIMHLVKRTTDMFELRQFSPDRTIEIDAGKIEAIFKIVGELI